jgi:hypothetical protein
VGLKEFFPREGVLRIFIALKNPSPWPGFETSAFESSDQHTTPPRQPLSRLIYLLKVTQTQN